MCIKVSRRTYVAATGDYTMTDFTKSTTTDCLEQFLASERDDILQDLTNHVRDLHNCIRMDPDLYMEPGVDEPAIDIRLCVDGINDMYANGPTWIIRTGDVQYDPTHSQFCAASCVGADTAPVELLDELFGQL